MIIDIEHEKPDFVYLIGDTKGSMSIRQYVDLITMMVRKLNEIDPMKTYRREWEEDK